MLDVLVFVEQHKLIQYTVWIETIFFIHTMHRGEPSLPEKFLTVPEKLLCYPAKLLCPTHPTQ